MKNSIRINKETREKKVNGQTCQYQRNKKIFNYSFNSYNSRKKKFLLAFILKKQILGPYAYYFLIRFSPSRRD